jgi:hypothetical protein
VCRLHAVLCELLPGGFSKEITAGQAAQLLASIPPDGAVAAARHELAVPRVGHPRADRNRDPRRQVRSGRGRPRRA